MASGPAEADKQQQQGSRFNLRELSGSLGDLGTLLPISIGLIVINGLDATAVLVCIGVYYVLSGLYFRVTVPVQPMKVIGAYAIARVLSPLEITSAGLWVGALLLVLAATGAITWVAKRVPRPTIRGVQLTTGMLLFVQGVRFMLGDTALQTSHGAAEPFLSVAAIGPVPIGILLGAAAVAATLLLLDSRKVPAALLVVAGGVTVSLALGGHSLLSDLRVGLNLPTVLPYGLPTKPDLVVALLVLSLPQLPMTVGNAIIAQADLTKSYFGLPTAQRSSPRALALSMALANLAAAAVGGMPMCHGAGGLAAHYRFGARTSLSNWMIGLLFVAIGVLFGAEAVALLSLIPLSVLGALLVFAGAQLALMILDVDDRRDMFVVLAMLGIALATNLAWGFGVGIALAYAFKHPKLSV